MSDRLNDDVLKLVKRVLLCLCRTSRRYRAIAQPLLWRHVRVTSPKQLEQLRASSAASGLGRYTVAYDVDLQFAHGSSDALDVSDFLPNIVALSVVAARDSVDVALLVKHQALENVELRNVYLDGPSAAPSRKLKRILIVDSAAPTSFLRQWFTPSLLPALRTVHVDRLEDLSSSLPVQLDDILARPLLGQLDCVVTSSEHVDPQSVLGDGVEPPVLFLRHGRSAPLPRHSNPHISPDWYIPNLREWYDALAEVAARPTSEPPVVVVLTPRVADLAGGPSAGYFKGVVQGCAMYRVRLILPSERQPGSKGPLTLEFHEFWEYARELKAAREGSTGR
ncbi:hypothetical protein JCM3775_005146 [Rhodotorula graminis]